VLGAQTLDAQPMRDSGAHDVVSIVGVVEGTVSTSPSTTRSSTTSSSRLLTGCWVVEQLDVVTLIGGHLRRSSWTVHLTAQPPQFA